MIPPKERRCPLSDSELESISESEDEESGSTSASEPGSSSSESSETESEPEAESDESVIYMGRKRGRDEVEEDSKHDLPRGREPRGLARFTGLHRENLIWQLCNWQLERIAEEYGVPLAQAQSWHNEMMRCARPQEYEKNKRPIRPDEIDISRVARAVDTPAIEPWKHVNLRRRIGYK